MIEVKNYDGKLVGIPFWRIKSIIDFKSGQSCTIYLDGDDNDSVFFCTESRKVVTARYNKYLNDNRPFAIITP